MSEKFIKKIPHNPIEPVRVERDGTDSLIVEGVRFDGDFFRTLAYPSPYYLYAIRRDGEQVVLTVIHNKEESDKFFEEIYHAI
jgi:hypothetical protein